MPEISKEISGIFSFFWILLKILNQPNQIINTYGYAARSKANGC